MNEEEQELDQQQYYQSIRGLIEEKVKVEEEEIRINRNKNLTLKDKVKAVNSARSLSKTINGLIDR